MNMPKRMQAYKMREELNRLGVSADLVDLEARIDGSLTYPENYRIVMRRYTRVDNKAKKSKSRGAGISDIDLSYASQSHQARSRQARAIDESRTACKTFTLKQLHKNSELLQKWYNNPSKFDIEGIDTSRIGKCKRRK